MTKVLSIDVGVRHLGLCFIEAPNTILRWKEIEVTGKPVDSSLVASALTQALAGWERPDMVVIERQPGKSVVMSRVQNFCEMYAYCRLSEKVSLMEPKTKLVWASKTAWWPNNISLDKKKWTYRERKTAAILCATSFLQHTQQLEWLHMFRGAPKRDDLADALLQGLSRLAFLKHTGNEECAGGEEGSEGLEGRGCVALDELGQGGGQCCDRV